MYELQKMERMVWGSRANDEGRRSYDVSNYGAREKVGIRITTREEWVERVHWRFHAASHQDKFKELIAFHSPSAAS
jgi:hypothetical protein